MWTVVRSVILTVAAGLAAGLLVALGAARAFSAALFNVSPADPLTLMVVTAVLALVSTIAACVPAMRATRVDPAVVLRCQ
jgi:hypothetical protein